MTGFVYFLANRKRGALDVGVTQDVVGRTHQHKSGEYQSFSRRYSIVRLVYFEELPTIQEAIAREKQLKNWKRDWKIELIENNNPEWLDLASNFKDS